MDLVDTNVWLELLLEQQRAAEVRRFLASKDPAELAITEFSLYSIGIILCRLSKEDVLESFLSDTVGEGGVDRVSLGVDELRDVVAARRRYKLDFDDGYQYVGAKKLGYTLVSFDTDFDRTDIGRQTPGQAIGE